MLKQASALLCKDHLEPPAMLSTRCYAVGMLRLAALVLFGVLATSVAPLLRAADTQNDALAAAIRAGRLSEIQKLLDSGAGINEQDKIGNAPLLDAIAAANVDVAAYLLRRGADVNLPQGGSGLTALQYAVVTGQSAMTRLLLAAGARTDVINREQKTVLHLACIKGNLQVIDALLAAHSPVEELDSDGRTALDEAILHGQSAVVSLLLAHQADVKHVRPSDGRGPLDTVCIKGFAGMIEPLVNAGADLTQRDRSGQSPLDLALAYKNPNAVAALLRLSSRKPEAEAIIDEAMERATLKGRTEVVRYLLNAGFDPNRATPVGSTYLHDAALKGRKTIVELLLDRHAAIGAKDQDGETPLHDAALGGDPSVIALLLDRGANVNESDLAGGTPLMLAASMGRSEAVALLLRRGANPLARDRSGNNALDRAKQTDDLATIQLLENAVAAAKLKPRAAGQRS